MIFSETFSSFQNAALSHGLLLPKNINATGKIERFYVEGDKPGTKNGWYIFFRNNISCGVYGNWKEGITYKWCAKSFHSMSQSEYLKYTQQIFEAKRSRDEERKVEQNHAAQQATNTWESSKIASPTHPYLINKLIQPFYARQIEKNLVLPIMDIHGKQWSLQYISPMGDKWFLTDGAIKSHFIPIQHKPIGDRAILICEGFATGATLASAYLDFCVVAATSSGNLKPVALKLRQHLPNTKLIIAADDDRLNPDNPGLKKARDAAIAAGAFFTQPQWPHGAPLSLTDFNDLVCWVSANEVKHG
jgi:putative DNA primase/helicase